MRVRHSYPQGLGLIGDHVGARFGVGNREIVGDDAELNQVEAERGGSENERLLHRPGPRLAQRLPDQAGGTRSSWDVQLISGRYSLRTIMSWPSPATKLPHADEICHSGITVGYVSLDNK